jgi:transcription-repair coupling factor (superfamily II helicase)
MQDVLVTREMIREWGQKAQEHWSDEIFERELREKQVFAEGGQFFPGLTFLLPIVFPLESTLFDYAEGAVLVLDETELLQETHKKFLETLQRRYEQSATAGNLGLPPQNLFWAPEDFVQPKVKNARLHLEELGAAEFLNAAPFPVRSQPAARWHGRIKELAEEVRTSFAKGTQVVLLGSTLGMAERLRDFLHEYDIPFRLEFGDQPLKAAETLAPLVGIGRLSAGFHLRDASLVLYAETDIFDEVEHAQPAYRRRQKLSAFISDLQDLKPGDYVVHVDHGIGTYSGITLVHDRECMVLIYHGGDRIFVPLERLDLIQKYSSTEGAKPQLDKLGGTSWVQRKTRVKRAIRDMAQELLQLYAQRKLAHGYAFSPDSAWQKNSRKHFLTTRLRIS